MPLKTALEPLEIISGTSLGNQLPDYEHLMNIICVQKTMFTLNAPEYYIEHYIYHLGLVLKS